MAFAGALLAGLALGAQAPKKPLVRSTPHLTHPKLVVLIVVDQMRGDYVDKFRGQWTGGLKRLVEEGAWFHEAVYPYAATETCVSHATISTGAFPANHGMIANAWWDREQQKMVTCTSDPNARNVAYAGGSTKGGDSAAKMQLPSFADELRFQTGGATHVFTFSLKARSAITLAGHKGEVVMWFDAGTGSWATSDSYGVKPFAEEYVKRHPVKEDYGKTWAPALPPGSYLYEEKAFGAATIEGWGNQFPYPLRGKTGSAEPDQSFYEEWASSPYADTYLTKIAEAATDALRLWNTGETDFLGIGYSSVDHIGHTFGPRSWEMQDILVRLDKDLGELFTHLDQAIGRGNYVVALTGDHGVAPIPADLQRAGLDAGVLSLPELKDRLEKALEPFNYTKPAIARIVGNEIYFAPGVYGQLKQDLVAMKVVMDAAQTMPGVAAVYRAEDLSGGTKSLSQTRTAVELSYFAGRSGDLYVLQKPYWLTDSSTAGSKRYAGTDHGSPYNYDQHVPLLLMGYGIQPGDYFAGVTPADIAPTLAALCGITLATRDGRVLAEALHTRPAK
ncbi:MAG TPA: alkaline phosphatase family protein [Verrucomicrobiae bacterium]|nr:alkaline phosphatase family protein [Verrucomicrobiae bacterium]